MFESGGKRRRGVGSNQFRFAMVGLLSFCFPGIESTIDDIEDAFSSFRHLTVFDWYCSQHQHSHVKGVERGRKKQEQEQLQKRGSKQHVYVNASRS